MAMEAWMYKTPLQESKVTFVQVPWGQNSHLFASWIKQSFVLLIALNLKIDSVAKRLWLSDSSVWQLDGSKLKH